MKKCFKFLGIVHVAAQCPNRRTMILRGKDEYKSQEDETSDGVASNKENSESAYPCEGELLMIRIILNNQPIAKQKS